MTNLSDWRSFVFGVKVHYDYLQAYDLYATSVNMAIHGFQEIGLVLTDTDSAALSIAQDEWMIDHSW